MLGNKATMFFICFILERALDLGSALPKKTCVFFLSSSHFIILVCKLSWDKTCNHFFNETVRQAHFIHYLALFLYFQGASFIKESDIDLLHVV